MFMPILFLLIAIIVGVIGWLIKLGLKSRMQRGLGRKVEDRELTSIASWMDALPDDNNKK
jgi:hypothetical protein